MSSISTSVKTLSRFPMKFTLAEQRVDSDNLYYSIKSICGSKDIQNIAQRRLPLKIIYDYSKHSGLDVDRVHITRHINGTGSIKAWDSNLARAESVYASVSDTDNSGQGFTHECDICLICEWPINENINRKTKSTRSNY